MISSKNLANNNNIQLSQQTSNNTYNFSKQEIPISTYISTNQLPFDQGKKDNISDMHFEKSFAGTFQTDHKNNSYNTNKPQEIPLTNFNSSKSNNQPTTVVELPQKVNKSFDLPNPNNFDFDNKFVKPTAVPQTSSQPINTDFNFEGFDGTSSFKDFQDKQSDDIFRKSDFGKWDDF
jgi:hypothetical protein